MHQISPRSLPSKNPKLKSKQKTTWKQIQKQIQKPEPKRRTNSRHGKVRTKALIACTACRRRKTRCGKPGKDGQCQTCRETNRDCNFDEQDTYMGGGDDDEQTLEQVNFDTFYHDDDMTQQVPLASISSAWDREFDLLLNAVPVPPSDNDHGPTHATTQQPEALDIMDLDDLLFGLSHLPDTTVPLSSTSVDDMGLSHLPETSTTTTAAVLMRSSGSSSVLCSNAVIPDESIMHYAAANEAEDDAAMMFSSDYGFQSFFGYVDPFFYSSVYGTGFLLSSSPPPAVALFALPSTTTGGFSATTNMSLGAALPGSDATLIDDGFFFFSGYTDSV